MLNQYDIIALDLDETLINGYWSNHLQNFVRNYHDKKDIHIVTFRSENEYETIITDLQNNNLFPEYFKKIITTPIDFWTDYETWYKYVLNFKTYNLIKQERVIARNPNHNLYFQKYKNLTDWKGRMCYENNAQIIVDDLDDIVKPGCELYDIHYVSSHKKHRYNYSKYFIGN